MIKPSLIASVAVLAAAVVLAAPAADKPKDEVKPGLVAVIYSFDDAVTDFPDIPADKKPAVKRVEENIDYGVGTDNWPDTQLQQYFFIRWTGSVKAAKDGTYKFSVDADDGARLYIDGKLVVDNGGIHPMTEVDGEVELKAGEHEFKLEFFQNEGESGCRASWQQPGKRKAIIPASAFSHKTTAE